MYTATITSKSIQRAAKKVVVDVEFTDGVSTFTEKFSFSLDVIADTVKQTIKQYINRIEQAEADTSIAVGAIDLTAVTLPEPTTIEVQFNTWRRKTEQLEKVKKLIDLGVTFDAANQQRITDLTTDISTTFKPVFINMM